MSDEKKTIPRFWRPTAQERTYLELVMSMATDSLLVRGVATRGTFTSNLRMIADQMDNLNNPTES